MKTHVDGVGGQKSFKVKSFFGAIEEFVFCDDGTDSHIPKIYSTHEINLNSTYEASSFK